MQPFAFVWPLVARGNPTSHVGREQEVAHCLILDFPAIDGFANESRCMALDGVALLITGPVSVRP